MYSRSVFLFLVQMYLVFPKQHDTASFKLAFNMSENTAGRPGLNLWSDDHHVLLIQTFPRVLSQNQNSPASNDPTIVIIGAYPQ